jgi:hypothetical protein
MVDAMKSTELSYSMVVEDLFWYTKGSFQGQAFPASCMVTGTDFHPNLHGFSSLRPNATRNSK